MTKCRIQVRHFPDVRRWQATTRAGGRWVGVWATSVTDAWHELSEKIGIPTTAWRFVARGRGIVIFEQA